MPQSSELLLAFDRGMFRLNLLSIPPVSCFHHLSCWSGGLGRWHHLAESAAASRHINRNWKSLPLSSHSADLFQTSWHAGISPVQGSWLEQSSCFKRARRYIFLEKAVLKSSQAKGTECPWGIGGFTGGLSHPSPQPSFNPVTLARTPDPSDRIRLSSRLRSSTVGTANKMLFVDFDVKAFRVWSKGQKDSLDFRAEPPPHYDLLDIPLTQLPKR